MKAEAALGVEHEVARVQRRRLGAVGQRRQPAVGEGLRDRDEPRHLKLAGTQVECVCTANQSS